MTQSGYGARFLDRRTPPHIFTLTILAATSAMSMNIFLPSLPGMTVYFETDYSVMQLSVAIYLLVNGLLQILIGPISDKYGRRPVILWGTALFVVATLGCLLAPNVESFLAFRMMQAIVVIALVIGRAAVRDVVPEEQAASLIAYVTMGVAVAPMIGPMIGGALDSLYGWQAAFWVLVAAGLGGLILAYFDLGETKTKSGLSIGDQFGQYPELFRSPRFWGYSMASGFASGAFFAYLGGAPYVSTEVFGMSPARMGLYFGFPALGYFFGNWISGRYSRRLGVNRMVVYGSIVNVLGVTISLLVFLSGFGTAETFFGLMCLVGVGNGMTIPNATAGALSVRPHLAGTAAGLSGALMLALGAVLSALSGMLLTPGTGAYPLLWIMWSTAAAGLIAILYVVNRQSRLRL
jgi:DHA1 family bicyclomycin/chloramphenicol resistance-like MFS transporter